MNRTRLTLPGALALTAMVLAACTRLLGGDASMAPTHPVPPHELQRHVTCTECHAADQSIGALRIPYATFNHNEPFFRDHGRYSNFGDNGTLCTSCHRPSFCNDCHAARAALEAGIKHGNNVEYGSTHGGDYLTRHRIDGAMDPASCYKCHGRSNNEGCRNCHR